MPRRGTSNSSPGRNCSFTDRGSETGSTQRKYTLSQLTPQRAGLLSSPPSPPPRSGGPACTGPPQWTALIPPLTILTAIVGAGQGVFRCKEIPASALTAGTV